MQLPLYRKFVCTNTLKGLSDPDWMSTVTYNNSLDRCLGMSAAGLTNDNTRLKGPTSPYCLKNMFRVVLNK